MKGLILTHIENILCQLEKVRAQESSLVSHSNVLFLSNPFSSMISPDVNEGIENVKRNRLDLQTNYWPGSF